MRVQYENAFVKTAKTKEKNGIAKESFDDDDGNVDGYAFKLVLLSGASKVQ